MKKHLVSLITLCLWAATLLTISSCQQDDPDGVAKKESLDWRANQNSFLYPPTAHPFGNSFEEWGVEYWKESYSQDCETAFTPQVVVLSDKVVTFMSFVGDNAFDITIPRDKALFLPLASIVNDYPCPDPAFEPAPGQTLEDFLQEGAVAIIDLIEVIELTFDGNTVENLDDYRFLSDLFYFTGHPEIAECYDPCITGEPQPGVFDGYMVMFKKMSIGEHTITMHGEMPAYELTWDMTLNITVE